MICFATEDLIEKILGVKSSKHSDAITLREIDRIIEVVGFNNTLVHSKLRTLTRNSCKDEDGPEQKDS